MCYVEEYRPRGDMFPARHYEVVVYPVEGQRQGLQIHQNTHYDVDAEDGQATGLQDVSPEVRAEEEDQ